MKRNKKKKGMKLLRYKKKGNKSKGKEKVREN